MAETATVKAHIVGADTGEDRVWKALEEVMGPGELERQGEADAGGAAAGRSAQLPESTWAAEYEAGNVRRPPYDLEALAQLYETNAAHKACVDAKVANTVGLGYLLVPAVKARGGEAPQVDVSSAAAQEELARLEELFETCNPEMTFTDVMRNVWTDVETLGNAYLEVTRSGLGEIDGFYHIPGTTMRVKADRSGFVQIREHRRQEFANLGEAGTDAEGEPLNEVIHFKKYTPQSSFYGIPDVLSAIAAAAGDKAARDYNIDFFEHNTVPRMAIIVEGGQLDDDLLNAIRQYMEAEVRGQGHKTLVLDVPGSEVKVRLEPLGMQRSEDAAFLDFRRANRDEILMVHRVPPSKITIVENANLANSRDQDRTFRDQVIRPEQRRIEFVFNRLIREQMGIQSWRFELRQMDLAEEQEQAEVAKIYAEIGAWTVDEIRAKQGLPALDRGGDR
ncbi:MAG: phage portal protein [Armatimonadota bacterium]